MQLFLFFNRQSRSNVDEKEGAGKFIIGWGGVNVDAATA